MKLPEILAPAGDLEKLKTAYMYGADACYMGMKSVSMRVKGSTMDIDEVEAALKIAKKMGKKLYLTMNIYAHENKMNFLEKEIERLKEMKKKDLVPDGLLISDPGILMEVKEACPWIDIHISTQANTLNASACEFWAKLGVKRVVLGREVSLREVKQIREKLKAKGIEVELEAFVHGAMCMAYSGRCLLSNFMTSRDANEGMCAHSCRWNYKMYLEEEKRPGEFIPVYEDEAGTSIMSTKDMCMLEHLDDIIDCGLDSAKIEGRHKTVFYAAIASRIYRQAMDLAAKGKKLTPELLDLMETINTRGYSTGFWYGKPGAEGQKYTGDRGDYNEKYCFAGVIRKVDGKTVDMEVRNTLKQGDKLDIITPKETIPVKLGEFRNAANDEIIEEAHAGQGFTIRFEVSEEVKEGYVLRKRL
ncbi:U32 family peptidase C-terminal domain-containing protein [Candidatus Peregrinibacteria bacterium]|nr:U32 family peptidase C-terminal domain-containing protein [Candidatus Peregrinibacteria bacterium]